jgi:hypothetical protein
MVVGKQVNIRHRGEGCGGDPWNRRRFLGVLCGSAAKRGFLLVRYFSGERGTGWRQRFSCLTNRTSRARRERRCMGLRRHHERGQGREGQGREGVHLQARCGVRRRGRGAHDKGEGAPDHHRHGQPGKDKDLGKKLMKGFLDTMKVYKQLPHTFFFLNAGVKLTTVNEEIMPVLQEIADLGVELYSCGTCLKHYNLGSELKVGRRGTTNHIVEGLQDFDKVVWI